MCRVCDGLSPAYGDYEGLVNAARSLQETIFPNQGAIINQAIELDKHRFSSGAEWGEPVLAPPVVRLIFGNSNPDRGLLLFVLCCWLDLQMDYRGVWSRLLEDANRWVEQPSTEPIPRGRFPQTTAPHLRKTLRTAQKHGSISSWFANAINSMVQRHGPSQGNLSRFTAVILQDLLAPSASLFSEIQALSDGRRAMLGQYKRLWMAIMFLRRDESLIQCLLTRALRGVPGGSEAVRYWYDEKYFSPLESELPIDSRVHALWPEVFNQPAGTDRVVAESAHSLAVRYDIAPSTFDAIFFGY